MIEQASAKKDKKRAFLVAVRDGQISAVEADSLAKELMGLVDTLGLETVSRELVYVRKKNALYGMGKGKAEELAQKAVSLEADCIIFDQDLTPSQQKNWEELTGIPAVDRQELIIQIFASRARSREAELQVNMAELVYALPRLRHKYIDLSRQRGGQYGTRGSGETRFETDRRRVEQRIQRLKKEIEEVKLQRQVQRKQRERQGVPVCAIVGYTNAGKSAIFNALTGAGVLAEDKLFATLDSTCRRFRLPLGTKVLLVDTVGFIRRLPHNLIDAFRSTLEEASRADILLNVLDASDPDVGGHYETTLSVLEELDAGDIRMVTVLNKIDILETIESPEGAFAEVRERMSLEALKKLFPGSVPVSAADGRGLIELCKSIEQVLNEQTIE